jgi:hypothetical protein
MQQADNGKSKTNERGDSTYEADANDAEYGADGQQK